MHGDKGCMYVAFIFMTMWICLSCIIYISNYSVEVILLKENVTNQVIGSVTYMRDKNTHLEFNEYKHKYDPIQLENKRNATFISPNSITDITINLGSKEYPPTYNLTKFQNEVQNIYFVKVHKAGSTTGLFIRVALFV